MTRSVDVTANVVPPELDTPETRAALQALMLQAPTFEDGAVMIEFLAFPEASQLRGAWPPASGRA